MTRATSAWPKGVRYFPCRVSGCFRPSVHFAMGNVARFGHVCAECWETFSEAERGLYAFQSQEDQAAKRAEGAKKFNAIVEEACAPRRKP